MESEELNCAMYTEGIQQAFDLRPMPDYASGHGICCVRKKMG